MAITIDVTPKNTTISPTESVTTTLDITTSIPTISSFRPLINAINAGGDGSLTYNSSDGNFTYTGPSATEVRAHLSAGTGVSYSSGQFSIGQDVATNATPIFTSTTVAQSNILNGATPYLNFYNAKNIANGLTTSSTEFTGAIPFYGVAIDTDNSNAESYKPSARIFAKFTNCTESALAGQMVFEVAKAGATYSPASTPPKNVLVLDPGTVTIGVGGTENALDLTDLAVNGNASVSGDLVVTGDLTVNGTETVINSTTLSVEDKNIVLGSVATPTDTTADGGGITLKGTTDKTLNWVDSTDSWTSSEHFELASAKTFRINANEVLNQTTLGSTVLASSLTSVGALDSGSITSNFSDIDIGDNVVTAAEFVGDLRGAVRFQAKAGESLAKGDVVYISSVSGQKPVVSKAQANSAATMPSFGLANAAVSANGNIEVISFGTFAHGDTTGGAEEWEFGDILYVSAATAGALTNVKPAGAANLIQNVGKVERVHASTGSIMVAGAGRTAATPNLDTGKFFIGDSNNYSTAGSFNNQFTNTSGTISLNGANITTVGTIGTGIWQGTAIANDYIGNHSAAKLTTGTLASDRISGNYGGITGIGTIPSLSVLPPSGTAGSITHVSRGGSATFILQGVGSVGDAGYVAPGSFTVSGAASATIVSDSNTIVGPTTVNSDLLKVVSTDDGATENPILSLYRNSSSIAVTDEIGAIEFSGNDANGAEHIYSRIYSEISVIDDGAEQANLRFAVSRSGGMEDPTMVLRQYGLELMPGNNLYLQGSNHLEYKGQSIVGDSSSPYDTKLNITNPTADRTILLPDAAGTVALTDSATAFTAGATTVNGALTVNSDLLEITSTVDDATEKPVISLYRDAGVPSTNDELGAIRWFGQNTSDEKQFYGGIYAQADVITDGAHKGSLNFHLADGSNNGTAISDVLVDINGDEDPTMNLTSELLTLNAGLIVNNDSMEIVSTEADADAMPIISLFKNGGSTTDSDDLGGIRFYGMNDHSTPKKTFYAGMYGELGRGDHGDEIGRIKWHLADGSGTEDAVTDVTAPITGDSDPTMTLEYFALNLKNDVNINFQAGGGTSYVAWDTGNNHTKLSADMTQDAVIECTLPTVSGTLAVTDAETFTGGMTVEGGLTSSPPIQTITGATTSVDNSTFLGYAGKRIMVTTTNALTMDLPDSAAADEGKTWVIMNASNNEITLDADNNGTAQYFRLLTGGAVITANQGFGGVEHIKITKGGIAELVCLGAGNSLTAPSYVIFGSGVHYE